MNTRGEKTYRKRVELKPSYETQSRYNINPHIQDYRGIIHYADLPANSYYLIAFGGKKYLTLDPSIEKRQIEIKDILGIYKKHMSVTPNTHTIEFSSMQFKKKEEIFSELISKLNIGTESFQKTKQK